MLSSYIILVIIFVKINDLVHKITFFLLQEAAARLEEIKKSIEAKMALRQSNLNPERPGLLSFFGLTDIYDN